MDPLSRTMVRIRITIEACKAHTILCDPYKKVCTLGVSIWAKFDLGVL